MSALILAKVHEIKKKKEKKPERKSGKADSEGIGKGIIDDSISKDENNPEENK